MPKSSFIGTAGIGCGAGSMQLLGVSLSIRLVSLYHSAATCQCCRFAAVGPVFRRCRSTAAAATGECRQCHFVSIRSQTQASSWCVIVSVCMPCVQAIRVLGVLEAYMVCNCVGVYAVCPGYPCPGSARGAWSISAQSPSRWSELV